MPDVTNRLLSSADPSPDPLRMTPNERRMSFSLAALFALRMLGLFLILPVFSIAAQKIPGGENAAMLGLALGIYGLTQACLQIPFGIASDRWGRRPVILFGLGLFTVGSIVAALATHLDWIILGRALQGAGAISAAVSAWLADTTRATVRTKAMAVIGASIGLSFALSLVLAPLLIQPFGLSGLFWFTALLAGLALLWVAFGFNHAAYPQSPASAQPLAQTPPTASYSQQAKSNWRQLLSEPQLLRLNLGIFSLHAVQTALFVVIPRALQNSAGIALQHHWAFYLPILLISFMFMMPVINLTERKLGYRYTMLRTVGLLALVMLALPWAAHSLIGLVLAMLLFFVGFNILEAMLPSLVSRSAPENARGLALGIYNTTQSLGLFTGGIVGGWLIKHAHSDWVYHSCLALLLLWLLALRHLREPSAAAKHP